MKKANLLAVTLPDRGATGCTTKPDTRVAAQHTFHPNSDPVSTP